MDSDEFTEARRVVVSDSFGISKRLQHGVALNDLVFESDLTRLSGFLALGNPRKELNDLLGILRLASTRFTTFFT